ncbi:MAG: cytoplasmic protein [Desulfobacteraceae bacterium]|nr:MAG: cytoplasmic protein [Desulfobacteraceae bacterium]
MADNGAQPSGLNFTVDKENLYREESVTDLKFANIQKLIPINLDGTTDNTRETVYIGRTQLNTPQGPVPIQAVIEAASLEDAMDAFPAAMEAETQKVVEAFQKMQAEQKKKQDSRIIVPGMQ